MKKLVIFLSLALVFLAVSCEKECFRPNHMNDRETESSYEKANKNPGSTDEDGKPIDTITDPNHDEDEDDKIKK